MDLGDVIDAIVLHLPLDKPTAVEGTPIAVNLKCSGDFLPYGHVDILSIYFGSSEPLRDEVYRIQFKGPAQHYQIRKIFFQ